VHWVSNQIAGRPLLIEGVDNGGVGSLKLGLEVRYNSRILVLGPSWLLLYLCLRHREKLGPNLKSARF
jgi:hypothetical protein